MSTVLITGASSGMGKETAKRLLAEGHTVYAVARRVDRMRDLEDLGATVLAMDITKEDDVVGVVDRITADTGGVDVLMNNAGFGMYGAVEDSSLDDARYQFEVNLFGLARLSQLVIAHMREQHRGTIINISSMGGKIYTPLGAWYHATKHALEGWSDCLRFELAPFGIDVVVIEPGAIETEWGEVMVEGMLERSGKGEYADLAQKLAAGSRRRYESGEGSPPSVIADTVSKALAAKRPRTRYAVGKYAKPLLFLRRALGDRGFDRVLATMVR